MGEASGMLEMDSSPISPITEEGNLSSTLQDNSYDYMGDTEYQLPAVHNQYDVVSLSSDDDEEYTIQKIITGIDNIESPMKLSFSKSRVDVDSVKRRAEIGRNLFGTSGGSIYDGDKSDSEIDNKMISGRKRPTPFTTSSTDTTPVKKNLRFTEDADYAAYRDITLTESEEEEETFPPLYRPRRQSRAIVDSIVVISDEDEDDLPQIQTSFSNDNILTVSDEDDSHEIKSEDMSVKVPPTPIRFHDKWPVFPDKDILSHNPTVSNVLKNPNNDQVCHSVPLGCHDNLAFIVDTRSLESIKDLTADDNGRYNRPSFYNADVKVDGSDYTLCRKYYKHKDSPNFVRTIYELREHCVPIRTLPIRIIKYQWKHGKEELILGSHGNSKSEEPYVRTKPSTLMKMKQSTDKPQAVFNAMYEEQGGSINIESFSAVPRTVTHIRRHQVSSGQTSGPNKDSDFSEVIKMCVEKSFVRNFDISNGKPRAFIATDRQIEDVKNFCCDGTTVLSFDPTFQLGSFYLTASTFRHPAYINTFNDVNVLMPGPFLIHTVRDTETYKYFGTCLSQLLNNKTVNLFGTDGEKALINGLKSTPSFANSDHLLCMLHHRTNCSDKLTKLGVSNKTSKKILRNIYGQQDGEVRYEGLVDCESPGEFDLLLHSLVPTWDKLEREDTEKAAAFSNWFIKRKSEECRSSMLKPSRIKAGLGNNPRQFTTNDNEALNSVIKRNFGTRNTWEKMIDGLKTFVQDKYQELVLAVHCSGNRRLSGDYKSYEVSKPQWLKMTTNERQTHLEKVNLAGISCDNHQFTNISVRPRDIQIDGCTMNEVADIISKADSIISNSGLSEFPGSTNVYACFENEDVFKVVIDHKKGIKCESKCKEYTFFDKRLCQHTLAVAEHLHLCTEYLRSVNKHVKKGSSANAVLSAQCRGAGKKKTIKRKGKNNKLGQLPQVIVERPNMTYEHPFSISFKAGLINTCFGCKRQFSISHNTPPHDIILKHMDIREWKDKNTGEQRKTPTVVPTYFHLNMDCVRRICPYVQIKDIIIYDEMKTSLSKEHISKLIDFGITVLL